MIPQRLSSLVRWVPALAIVGLCVFCADRGLLRLVYLQYALLGGWFVWVTRRPGRADWLVFLLSALVLGLVASGGVEGLVQTVRFVGSVLGLAAVAAAGVRTGLAAPSERARVWETLTAVALAPFCIIEVLLMRRALLNVQAPTFDLYAFALDQRLGGAVSFPLTRAFRGSVVVREFVWEVYAALPAILGVFFAEALRRGGVSRLTRAVLLLFVASVFAVAGYLMVPVAGPRFVFPDFPLLPPSSPPLHRLALPPEIERNGVPSMHLVAALLAWWNVGRSETALRLGVGAFLVGTVLATLGTGEHYLVDLILTVPFTLALQVALLPTPGVVARRRWTVAGAGAALTLVWMLLIRSATLVESTPVVVLYALTFASLVGVVYAEGNVTAARTDGP